MALDFATPEIHDQVRQSVRDCLKPFLPHREALRQQIFRDKVFPPELWEAICATGILGCVIPEEYGGNGMGLLPAAVAIETLAQEGFSNALMVLTTMDAACVLRNGSEEMKSRVLPRMASGELKCGFALTEPDAGSNAFRIRTAAVRDGDTFVVSGQKVFITGADVADRLLLVTRTTSREEVERQGLPKAFGMALFLLDPKAPGVDLKIIPTHGIEGMNQYTVYLDEVRIPAADLVGEVDMGSRALFNSLNPERILAAATACGMARFCLDRAVAYAKERKVFGERAIGSYQAIAHPLAKSAMELDASEILTRRAAWAFDAGLPPAKIGHLANVAKYSAAEMVIAAVDRSIQTLGGYGFSEEYSLIHYYQSARLLRTAPISAEMILNFVAEHELGLPRSY